MVVGNGLLGKAFESYAQDQQVLIFASGVSNSKLTTKEPFLRELDLLKQYLDFKGLIVYFSTCSIDDPTLYTSAYIQHKLMMESFIEQNFSNYLIVRLPNVVGKSPNPNTMLNFFNYSVINQLPIKIQKGSARYLIDITDVYRIVSRTIDSNNDLQITGNLINCEKITVEDIVSEIEKYHKKKVQKLYENITSNYTIEPSEIFSPYLTIKETTSKQYLKQLLKKYY